MGNIITWLHLSDFHIQKADKYNLSVVMEALLRDLETIIATEKLKPDFVVITGDLAYYAYDEEYKIVKKILDEIEKVVGIQKDHIFIVPGNHDISRSEITEESANIVNALIKRNHVNKFLNAKKDRKLVFRKSANFNRFIKEYFNNNIILNDKQYYYVKLINLSNSRIAILGLNSSWASGCNKDRDDKVDDERHLIVGESQVKDALEMAKNADFCIALLHHPFSWLKKFDRKDVWGRLKKGCDIILQGHVHETEFLQVKDPDSETTIIPAGACYESREYPNMFNFVRLDIQTGKGTIYFYSYSDSPPGFWVPDNKTYKNVKNGKYNFNLPRRIRLQNGSCKTSYWCSCFDHLIDTHTQLFAGRDLDIRKIRNFIGEKSGGYIFIESLPGYGKTSLCAKLVQDNPNFAYHFISQAYKTYGSEFNPTDMDFLLQNLCEQLAPEEYEVGNVSRPLIKLKQLITTKIYDKPRVILIDAIDEIDQHQNYLKGIFPKQLPKGVFVILTAREMGDHTYLPEIGLALNDIALHIKLSEFNELEIAQLLRAARDIPTNLARSNEFIRQLKRVSNGDPFYLRFLVEDIACGKITPHNIESMPSGLKTYLDSQFLILSRSTHSQQQEDILGYIIEAKGPLSRRDLINIVDGLNWINFDDIIKDIHRFLLVNDDTYTFCHRRFKEYFSSRM